MLVFFFYLNAHCVSFVHVILQSLKLILSFSSLFLPRQDLYWVPPSHSYGFCSPLRGGILEGMIKTILVEGAGDDSLQTVMHV